ncbi:isopropylmalate isomerase [uncultured Roseovarius sp.]|uniref:isopropylmalate isomerase n=1 Tax=uncultured Roseovarius sp. TaxID=293344 RepID=UPI002616B7C8|nr:isopropylmalate isomerase [uncultured Roseovarius sp.]
MSNHKIELWTCFDDRWSPTIGDPSIMGWVTVAAYGITALLTARLAISRAGQPERFFWLILALLLAALTINKQLDLQSALTAFARCMAKAQGWYENRKGVQTGFILGLLGASLVFLIALGLSMRNHLRRTWPAVLGVCFLTGFVAIRAVGFHHFDVLIKSDFSGIRINWLLELGGIGLILANVVALLTTSRNQTGPD